jgi:hypothetical protein
MKDGRGVGDGIGVEEAVGGGLGVAVGTGKGVLVAVFRAVGEAAIRVDAPDVQAEKSNATRQR